MANPEIEAVSWLRFFFASASVVALMAGLAFGLKYFAQRGWIKSGAREGRTKVQNALVVDSKRRLVVVQHDKTEHLLLLGPHGDLLLSSSPVVPSEEPPHARP